MNVFGWRFLIPEKVQDLSHFHEIPSYVSASIFGVSLLIPSF